MIPREGATSSRAAFYKIYDDCLRLQPPARITFQHGMTYFSLNTELVRLHKVLKSSAFFSFKPSNCFSPARSKCSSLVVTSVFQTLEFGLFLVKSIITQSMDPIGKDVYEMVQKSLKGSRYACMSLVRLSGAASNFVYRGVLETPLKDEFKTPSKDEPKTIIVKHTALFVASNYKLLLTTTRCVSAPRAILRPEAEFDIQHRNTREIC